MTFVDECFEFLGYKKIVDKNDIKLYECETHSVFYEKTADHGWIITFRTTFPKELKDHLVHSDNEFVYLQGDVFQTKHMIVFMMKLQELSGLPIIEDAWWLAFEQTMKKESIAI